MIPEDTGHIALAHGSGPGFDLGSDRHHVGIFDHHVYIHRHTRHSTLPRRTTEQLERDFSEPLVAGVTMIALMPELRDLDARQRDRGFKRDKAEWSGEAARQVGR